MIKDIFKEYVQAELGIAGVAPSSLTQANARALGIAPLDAYTGKYKLPLDYSNEFEYLSMVHALPDVLVTQIQSGEMPASLAYLAIRKHLMAIPGFVLEPVHFATMAEYKEWKGMIENPDTTDIEEANHQELLELLQEIKSAIKPGVLQMLGDSRKELVSHLKLAELMLKNEELRSANMIKQFISSNNKLIRGL